jgi:hypothetical protein
MAALRRCKAQDGKEFDPPRGNALLWLASAEFPRVRRFATFERRSLPLQSAHLIKRTRGVAALACSSERTMMCVVLPMADITILWQHDFGDVFGGVAELAIEVAVRTGQRVPCLGVVIKTPARPTVWVVAERAVRA